MSIVWSRELESGLDWQDRQHRELVQRCNRLLDAMDRPPDCDGFIGLFNFLEEYFAIHFHAEEQGMKKYRYPGASAHLEEHAAFMADMRGLKSEFEKSPSAPPVAEFRKRVVDWLLCHIGGTDKKLGRFIFEAGHGRDEEA